MRGAIIGGLRAVWNGPFHTGGALVRPVSVGDVLAKLLETAWRGAVLFVAVTGAAVSAAMLQDLLTADAPMYAMDEDAIVVEADAAATDVVAREPLANDRPSGRLRVIEKADGGRP